jgi:anthranilate phosphoribosyltransferase
MVGVFDRKWCRPFAEALAQLGTTHAWVVHGADGLDEVTTTGPTHVAALADGQITEFTIQPSDIGLEEVSLDALLGGTPAENAVHLHALLEGATGPYRDIVIFNAAAALVAGGHAASLADGAAMAKTSLDDGRARAALAALVRITNTPPDTDSVTQTERPADD